MTRDAEEAARALIEAIAKEQDWGDANMDPDNFGCACEGTVTTDPMPDYARPCSSCRARLVKRKALALRDALSRSTGGGGETVAWAARRNDGTLVHDDNDDLMTTTISEHVGWIQSLDKYAPSFAPHTLVPLYADPTGATGGEDRVAKIREYAVDSAAVCREAEAKRQSDLSKRENGTIADMLREQAFAWGEKAKSYDALVEFIDALARNEGGDSRKGE